MSDDQRPTDFDIARLRRDLAEIADARIDVPASVDEAILAQAHEQVRPAVHHMPAPRRTLRWAAAAALLGIGIVIAAVLLPGRIATTRVAEGIMTGDVDGNGRVDVLDAFLLARRIADGAPVPAADLNGDGNTDALDVDVIATIAVSLEEAG